MLKNFTEQSQKLEIQMRSRLYGIRKFEILAKWSKLKKSSWKNVYYKNQNATPEMIEYWCFLYPQDEVLITGKKKVSRKTSFWEVDIQIPLLEVDKSSIENRAIWVMNNWLQCNSIKRENCAQYLNTMSTINNCIEVKTSEWNALLKGSAKLTNDMLVTIATWNRAFNCWILTGFHDDLHQVNPSDLLTLRVRQAEEHELALFSMSLVKDPESTSEQPHLEQVYFEEEMRAASNRYVNNSH